MGNSRRTCEPTAANRTSSRSHAVLQVVMEGKGRVTDITQEVRTGKLFMVDLAGSERAAQTKVGTYVREPRRTVTGHIQYICRLIIIIYVCTYVLVLYVMSVYGNIEVSMYVLWYVEC